MKKFGLMKKLKEKRGGSTIFEVVICISLLTFIMFYPIATFSLTHKENLLEDVLTTTMQNMSVEGGLTDRVQNLLFLNLEAKNLIPPNTNTDPATRSKVKLTSNADARNGATGNIKYRDDADPTLSIEIQYPADKDVKFINGLSRLVGATDSTVPFSVADNSNVSWYYTLKGYILSEKVNY